MTILAIDQGTTSTRALLVEADGRSRLLHSIRHQQFYPQAGWVEHDPEELIAALRACLDAAAEVPGLAAVGLGNQGESCLAWDARTGEAVTPVIVWQDDRTSAMCAALEADGGGALVRERAGLPLDPYFSGSKLGWILRENPAARALAAKGHLRLGTTDAFFRERLTGRFASDVATASRTALMGLARCAWDADLCRLFGVPMDCLPEIGPTAGDLGTVPCGGRRVPLTASIVDQQAALYGHGCRSAGDAKMTFGTGAFALMVTGDAVPKGGDGPLPTVAWQHAGAAPVYALDGGVYAAASAVNFAKGLGLFGAFDEINTFDAPPAIVRGLAFVPALAGLACPHWNRAARGSWMGLQLGTNAADMVQAVLEGVALRMVEVVRSMEGVQAPAGAIPVDGGMSQNPYFCQFLADALGHPMRVTDVPDVTALGCAAMAADGAGLNWFAQTEGVLLVPNDLPPDAWATFDAARRAVEGFAAR